MQLTFNDHQRRMSIDHTTAHLYLRVKDAWLCKPTSLEVINLFRPTKEFVGAIMAVFGKLEKHKPPSRKCKDERVRMTDNNKTAAASELSKLDDFLSQAVKDILIPALKVRTSYHMLLSLYWTTVVMVV